MLYKLISDCIGIIPFCILVATASSFAGEQISKFLHSVSGWRKMLMFSMIASLFFIPPMAVGSFWAALSYHLLKHPLLNTLFYSLLLSVKLLPVSVMVFYFVPVSVTRQARHCMNLSGISSGTARKMRYQLAKSAWKAFAASALVTFLLSFSDFELASFLSVKHWTVALFDLNAGGLPVLESVKLCIFPVAIELALIIGFIFLYRDEKWLKSNDAGEKEFSKSITVRNFSWSVTLCGTALLFAIPLLTLVRSGIHGLPLVFDGTWFFKETITSLCFGLISALAAFYVSGLVFRRSCHGTPTPLTCTVILLLMIPGLTGALPLALTSLFIFQMPVLVFLRDTPVPLLVAATLFQLPYAFFLRYAFSSMIPDESVFIANSMIDSPTTREDAVKIVWTLKYAVSLMIFFIIFIASYFDITLSSVLTPPRMPTIFTRLYNLLHYGQNTKLSATVLLSVLVPAIVLLVSATASRLVVPIFSHPQHLQD